MHKKDSMFKSEKPGKNQERKVCEKTTGRIMPTNGSLNKKSTEIAAGNQFVSMRLLISSILPTSSTFGN